MTGSSARLAEALSEVVRNKAAGETIDEIQLRRRYPDLWEEIEKRLKLLDRMQLAAQKAADPPTSGEMAEADACDPHLLETLRRQLRGYAILHPISSGGQAFVFKARQDATRRTVALKVFPEALASSQRSKARFSRELELIAQLKHPNIVGVYEGGEIEGHCYYAMEFIEGLPFDDFVLFERPPLGKLIAMFVEICDGLSYAHQRGIIHRDLKPSNILVSEEWSPRILDFGLAKQLTDAAVAEGISMPGQVVGTPHYFSPEQFGSQDGHVDIRSDIYSLAVVFYQVLTGRFPYPVQGGLDVLRESVLTREAPALFDARHANASPSFSLDPLAPDLDAVIRTALHKRKEDRYQSAGEFAQELERVIRGEAVQAKSDLRLYQLRKLFRKHRIAMSAAAGFLAIILVSLVAIIFAWRRESEVARQSLAALNMAGALRTSSVLEDSGRLDDAVSLLASAVRIGEGEVFKSLEVRRFLSAAYFELSQIHMRDFENMPLAQEYADKAMRHAAVFMRESSDEPLALQMRGNIHRLEAELAQKREQWNVALDHIDQAVGMRTRLLSITTDDPRQQADLASSIRLRGKCLQHLQDYKNAWVDLSNSRRIYETLHKASPGVLDYKLELARTDSMIINWLLHQDTPQDDAAAVEKAAATEKLLDELRTHSRAKSRIDTLDSIMRSVSKNGAIAEKRIATRRTEPAQTGSTSSSSVSTGSSSPSSGSVSSPTSSQ